MQLVVIVAVLGLIMTLLVLYEVMLSVQVEVGTGVKGLLLSLLPSLPLFALGWYLKRRSQKKAKNSDGSDTRQLIQEEQLPEDTEPLPV